MISGFVMPLNFFKKGEDVSILLQSAFKRYFRLMIPLWAQCTLVYLTINVAQEWLRTKCGFDNIECGTYTEMVHHVFFEVWYDMRVWNYPAFTIYCELYNSLNAIFLVAVIS